MARRRHGFDFGDRCIVSTKIWDATAQRHVTARLMISSAKSGAVIYATVEANGETLRFDDGTPLELLDKVRKALVNQKAIKWNRVIVIDASGGRDGGRDSARVDISLYFVSEGTDVDGNKYWRWTDNDDDQPKSGSYIDRNDDKTVVEDTPERRAALESILSGIDSVAGKIAQLLSQKMVKSTLANFDARKLLLVQNNSADHAADKRVV